MEQSLFARRTSLFAAAAALTLASSACTDKVEVAAQSSGAGGATSGGPSGGPGSGGGGGVTSGPGGVTSGSGGGISVDSPPAGHYMQPWIGNCINAEEWFTFGSSPTFTQTFVDRDFCGPHSVTKSPGSFFSDGHTYEIAWETPQNKELRRHTFALLDPYGSTSSWPPVDGYEPGTLAINRMAYFRAGDAPIWHRDDRRRSQSAITGDVYDAIVAIDITLDAPLKPSSFPEKCEMTVDISISVSVDDAVPPDTANETFKLPCTYTPTNALQWISLWGDGFENSDDDGSWSAYLDQMGIWKKYPSSVSNVLYESFRPRLYYPYPPDNTTRLFHNMQFAWYQQMKNPPPDKID